MRRVRPPVPPPHRPRGALPRPSCAASPRRSRWSVRLRTPPPISRSDSACSVQCARRIQRPTSCCRRPAWPADSEWPTWVPAALPPGRWRLVLHLPAATAAGLLAGLQARDRALRHLDGPGVTVAGADQLWADPSLPPARSYTDAIATGYGAGVAQAPLLYAPAKAAAQIDADIAGLTKGHIPHLLTAERPGGRDLRPDRRAVPERAVGQPVSALQRQHRAVRPGGWSAGKRAIHVRRRVRVGGGGRLDRGPAALPRRSAGDAGAAAAGRAGRQVPGAHAGRRGRAPDRAAARPPGRPSSCRRSTSTPSCS